MSESLHLSDKLSVFELFDMERLLQLWLQLYSLPEYWQSNIPYCVLNVGYLILTYYLCFIF